MCSQTIFVDVVTKDYPKTITLECRVPTNVWELTQLLKPHLLEHKYQHRSINKTIVLRDKRGVRLHPYRTIHKAYGQKGTHLTAELMDKEVGNQGRRYRGKSPEVTGSEVMGTCDIDDVLEIKDEDSPTKDVVLISPAKRKRKSDGSPECSLPKHHALASKYQGDDGQAPGIQTRRKSRTRLALKTDHSSDNEEHHRPKCAECGDGERIPSVRLSLKRKHNAESGQSPSKMDLTLHQRACQSCLGFTQREKPTLKKQRLKTLNTTDSVDKTPSAKTGVSVKKIQKTQISKEDHLSSSLNRIHLEDNVEEPRKRTENCAKKKEQNAKLSQRAITSNIKVSSAKAGLGKSNDSTQQGKTRTSPRKQLNSGAAHSKISPDLTSTRKKNPDREKPLAETKEKKTSVTRCVDTEREHSYSSRNDESLASKDAIESVATVESVSGSRNQNGHEETCVELIGGSCDSAKKKEMYDSTKNTVDRKTIDESLTGILNTNNLGETSIDGEACVELVDIGRSCDSANKKELRVDKALARDKSAKKSTTKPADDGPKQKAGISIKYFFETNREKSDPSIQLQTNSTKNDILDLTERDNSVDKPVPNKSKYFKAPVGCDIQVHEAKPRDTSQLSTVVVDYDGNRPSVKVVEKSAVQLLGITHSTSKNVAGPTLVEDDSGLTGCDYADGIFLLSPVRDANIEGEQSFVVDTDHYKDDDSPDVGVENSQDVLNEIHSESDEGDPIILKIARYELRRSDLETLEEGEWLNDCVINSYFILLKEASPLQIFTHSSFFFFSLYKRGYEGVQRWTKNVDLFTQDLVFFPIHNKSHWTLVVVHIKESVIEYYNSSTLLDGYPRSMLHIRNYLLAEAEHRGKASYCNITWEMYIVTDIPRQQNMDDCGLFICQYAKKLSLKENVTFDSRTTSNLRKQMLCELLNSRIEKS